MKKLFSAVAGTALSASLLLSSCGTVANPVPESLKILFIGNSFACDTIEHVGDIALNLGVTEIDLYTLYIGGCSINKHYANLQMNSKSYELFENHGGGWEHSLHHSIADTIALEDWDWIAIQHGSGDGSRYAEEESYKNLPALVQEVKALAPKDTKIAFNMTWVGAPNSHEELIAFGNQQQTYYRAIASLTESTVASIEGIDLVCPTGTAIQNARSAKLGYAFNRDGYHLSMGIGRYTAGLTFFKAITGADISAVTWTPAGNDIEGHLMDFDDQGRLLAIEAAQNAIENPYSVTPSSMAVSSKTTPE